MIRRIEAPLMTNAFRTHRADLAAANRREVSTPARMIASLMMVFAVLLSVQTAGAQDSSDMASDSLSSAGSYAGTVGVNSHLRNGKPARPQVSRSTRLACARKEALAEKLGAAKARRLYVLCRQIGR